MTPDRRDRGPACALARARALLLAALLVAASAVATAADAQTPPAPHDSLSVGECVALAREHAPEVEARTLEAHAARSDSAAARLNGRPNYSIFGGVIAYPEGAYDPALTNLGEYGVRLGLAVPLMDGGARKRERAQAALQATSAAAARDLASRDAGLRAAAVALGALHQRELEHARRESLTWLDQLAELVGSGVRAGAHGRADEARVLLERDATRSDLVSVIESRDALLRELAQLIGRESGLELLVSESATAIELPPSESDSLALFAGIETAPEIRAVRSLEASERLAVEEAEHRSALHIDLAADAGIWGADVLHQVPDDFKLTHPNATLADRMAGDLGASIALQFRRPLLDRSASLGVSSHQALLESARRRGSASAAERRRSALDLLGRWRSAAQRLDLAVTSTQRAEENLLRAHNLYAGGSATLLELLDARTQLDEARTRQSDARLETRLAHWEGELQR